MIRKTAAGYTVFARTGRKMGTYRTIDQAQVRLGQLEAFKAQRSPLGRMSPTVRAKSKEGRKGYYVRAKSGRSMGWYPTKAEAMRRKGQLEANGAKFFKETRGYTRQTSPTGGFKPVRLHENIRSGTLVKVQGKRSAPGKGLSYEPGRVRLLEDARVGGWDVYDVRLADGSDGSIYGFSIVGKKPFAFAHSWPGQPRRHAHAARLGQRRAARSPAPHGSRHWIGKKYKTQTAVDAAIANFIALGNRAEEKRDHEKHESPGYWKWHDVAMKWYAKAKELMP